MELSLQTVRDKKRIYNLFRAKHFNFIQSISKIFMILKTIVKFVIFSDIFSPYAFSVCCPYKKDDHGPEIQFSSS
jgi:hypothetical protein